MKKNRKIRLAIIGSRGYPYVYGGYETFVKEFAERIVEHDVEVHVYCQMQLFKNKPSSLNGIFLHYIPSLNHKAVNQILHSLLSLIHVCFTKADVVLVLNLAAGPFGWIPRLAGKKMIINTDGLEWKRPKWKGIGSWYFKFGAWCATKFYNELVSDAEAMREVYLSKFNRDSTCIAYGAPSYKQQGTSALAKINLEPNSYYLIVGRLIPDNNADLIVKEFLKSESEKKLVIVGDVRYQDTYANSLKSLESERLVFTGYVNNQDELLSLYQHCFSYLHGHEFGGTNPAMLKAMSNKCAILALDTPFNREMLSDGRFGLFFSKDSGNLSQLIKKIENNDDELHYFRTHVNEGLTEKYNWLSVTKNYLHLIKHVLKPKKND